MTGQDAAKRAEGKLDALWLTAVGPSTSSALATAKNDFLLGAYQIVDAAVAEALKEHHCWCCKWRD